MNRKLIQMIRELLTAYCLERSCKTDIMPEDDAQYAASLRRRAISLLEIYDGESGTKPAGRYYCGSCGESCREKSVDIGDDSKREVHRSDCHEGLLFNEAMADENYWTAKEWKEDEQADSLLD